MFGLGLTLVESRNPAHRQQAFELLSLCNENHDSIRVGITGVPGVGKSTFIESFGSHLISKGKKVAVLAIDPSSSKSKGSILGDKTRMEKLSMDPMAFIRPAPAAGSLGGVADATRASIALCEAAGFDVIIVETVGVGQSETAVFNMVDIFLLLMLAGAGDELQGIKRGIMEMADILIVNKADGDNQTKARDAAREYKRALHLFPPNEKGWQPKTLVASGLTGMGMENIWTQISNYHRLLKSNGHWEKQRLEQQKEWFRQSCNDIVLRQVFRKEKYKNLFGGLSADLEKGTITEFEALFRFSRAMGD